MLISAMQGNKLMVLLGILMTVVSCTKKMSADEYARYVSNPDNGLRKDQVLGDFELSVMYEPVDYILAKESSKQDRDQRQAELAKYEHFQFRMKLLSGGNILQYQPTELNNETSRVYHYSFDARRDFMLISGTDTATCLQAHYSRNYNLSPTVDLTLAFEIQSKEQNWQLIFTDDQFGLGRVKFLFKREDLADLPQLKN